MLSCNSNQETKEQTSEVDNTEIEISNSKSVPIVENSTDNSNTEILETYIDRMEEKLSPLRNFILPSGYLPTSFAHMSRCICRRAERCIVGLSEVEEVDEVLLKFFNRLSDYFFVLARFLSFSKGLEDIPWKPAHNK